jgi:hypothetical protein
MKISLQRALLLLLGGTVLVALIPGGLLLDRRLSLELERAARERLAKGCRSPHVCSKIGMQLARTR